MRKSSCPLNFISVFVRFEPQTSVYFIGIWTQSSHYLRAGTEHCYVHHLKTGRAWDSGKPWPPNERRVLKPNVVWRIKSGTNFKIPKRWVSFMSCIWSAVSGTWINLFDVYWLGDFDDGTWRNVTSNARFIIGYCIMTEGFLHCNRNKLCFFCKCSYEISWHGTNSFMHLKPWSEIVCFYCKRCSRARDLKKKPIKIWASFMEVRVITVTAGSLRSTSELQSQM